MRVDIVDIGSGNIESVANWFEANEISVNRAMSTESLDSNYVVLPGMGAAENMMDRLVSKNFDRVLIELSKTDVKLIGICLGFQILFNWTEENGGVETLGVLDGTVERLKNCENGHNGWESCRLNRDTIPELKYWRQISHSKRKHLQGRCFYNHEYGVVCKSLNGFKNPISNTFQNYTGLVLTKNILGMQFHPEKSQIFGNKLLEFVL